MREGLEKGLLLFAPCAKAFAVTLDVIRGVDVNEEGTEAAAVTVVGIELTAVDPNQPPTFHMRVDRPFFFAIRDDVSGTILFMGSIVNPATSGAGTD